MSRLLVAAFLLFSTISIQNVFADDTGIAKAPAAYLNFAFGARSAAMGNAQTAVEPEDSHALFANPSLLFLAPRHLTTTSGLLGIDRSFYFLGYVPHAFNWDIIDGFTYKNYQYKPVTADNIKPILEPIGGIDMGFAFGATLFGIRDIEGRSDFGLTETDFQNIERAFFLSYAFRTNYNLSFGFTGKILSQTIQDTSANGLSWDMGLWYGFPVTKGKLGFALTGRDVGGKLRWKVRDSVLKSDFSYKEPLSTKLVSGLSYLTPGNRWLFAMDIARAKFQKIKLHTGIEWRSSRQLAIRAGLNSVNPTVGFGFELPLAFMRIVTNYAFEYDPNLLSNPQWLTINLELISPSTLKKRKNKTESF